MLNMIIVSKRTHHFNSKRKIIDICSKNFFCKPQPNERLSQKRRKNILKNAKKRKKTPMIFQSMFTFLRRCVNILNVG